MGLNDSSVHVFTSLEKKVVPDPANRCSSPVNALSISDGIPGKIKTLRTLTWEKEKCVKYKSCFRNTFMLFFKLEDFTVTSHNLRKQMRLRHQKNINTSDYIFVNYSPDTYRCVSITLLFPVND